MYVIENNMLTILNGIIIILGLINLNKFNLIKNKRHRMVTLILLAFISIIAILAEELTDNQDGAGNGGENHK